MAYCCPHCNWKWKRKYFYKVRDNSLISLDFMEEYKPFHKGDQVYPIFLDEWTSVSGTIWWREIHKCPNCKWEMEFDMNKNIAEEIIKGFKK